MPTYDYKCKECGYIFETFQKMSEKPLEFCPKCAGPVKRLISAAGIIFKGSGFHVTDYKKDSKGHNKPTTTPASTPKKEKPAKKKESKA